MKNFEKYIEKIGYDHCHVHNIRVHGDVDKAICNLDCHICRIQNELWLLEEYKEPIQLTHDEYVILKNIDKDFKFLIRNSESSVFVFDKKPFKTEKYWNSNGDAFWFMYDHLFQFVKWEDEEPYEIAKLIANYEKEHSNA